MAYPFSADPADPVARPIAAVPAPGVPPHETWSRAYKAWLLDAYQRFVVAGDRTTQTAWEQMAVAVARALNLAKTPGGAPKWTIAPVEAIDVTARRFGVPVVDPNRDTP